MPPARSYEKTYNLADDFSFYGAINVRLSVGYDKNQRELSRQVVRNNILTCFCATESLPPTGLRSNYVSRIPVTPAAGGGTQTANYAVPERASPTSSRHHVHLGSPGHANLGPPGGIVMAAGVGKGLFAQVLLNSLLRPCRRPAGVTNPPAASTSPQIVAQPRNCRPRPLGFFAKNMFLCKI